MYANRQTPIPSRWQLASQIIAAILFRWRSVPPGVTIQNMGAMGSFVDLSQGASDGNQPETHRRPARRSTEPDCVIVFDERGRIQHFSPEAERLFGYQEEDVLDLDAGLLMPGPDDDWPEGDIWYNLAPDNGGMTGLTRIVIGRRRDGGTFPLELTLQELALAGERLFSGAIRDLSPIVERDRHRQELEAELLRISHTGELNRLTSILLNRVVGPLTVMRDDLTAGQGPLHARDRVNASVIMASLLAIGARAAELIQELHAIAKPGLAERRVENLWDTIEVASGLALSGVQQALTLRIDVADDAAEAVIDRNQIQQVLRNMILNALRARAASARREITIATARVGDMVELRLADASLDLAEEIRPRSFPLFATPGHGLFGPGLSHCRAIVEAHGGEIYVEDGASGSVVFRLTLPSPAAESAKPRGRYTRA
jgi:two-component system sensor kinase FixL